MIDQSNTYVLSQYLLSFFKILCHVHSVTMVCYDRLRTIRIVPEPSLTIAEAVA